MSLGFGISDISECSRLAVQTWSDLKNAPREFESLRLELRSLNATLAALADEESCPTSLIHTATAKRRKHMREILENCANGMDDLQRLVLKYSSLRKADERKFREWLSFATKDKQGPRDKLAIHTASISMFLMTLSHSSLGRLEFLLKNRQPSAMASMSLPTNVEDDMATLDSRDQSGPDMNSAAWTALGQDLYHEGITGRHIEQYQEELKAYLRYLVRGETPFWQSETRAPLAVHEPKRKALSSSEIRFSLRFGLERRRAEREAQEKTRIEKEHKLKGDGSGLPRRDRSRERSRVDSADREERSRADIETIVRHKQETRRLLLKEMYKGQLMEINKEHAKEEERLRVLEEISQQLKEQAQNADEIKKVLILEELSKVDSQIKDQEAKVLELRLKFRKRQSEVEEEARKNKKEEKPHGRIESRERQERLGTGSKEVDRLVAEFQSLFEIEHEAMVGVEIDSGTSTPSFKQEDLLGDEDKEKYAFNDDEDDDDELVVFPTRREPVYLSNKEPLTRNASVPTRIKELKIQLDRYIAKRDHLKRSGDPQGALSDLETHAIPIVIEKLKSLGCVFECDVCQLPIADTRFHCLVCDDGNWDSCEKCWNKGNRCHNSKHAIKEIDLVEDLNR